MSIFDQDLMPLTRWRFAVIGLMLCATLSACTGRESTTRSAGSSDADLAGEARPPSDDVAPTGAIVHFGALTVGDDAGVISDLVGGFFEFTDGVSREFLTSLAVANESRCQVDSDDRIDFEEISAGYIPNINGVLKRSVSAGETISLLSAGGTYAELTRQPAGEFIFYDLPNRLMLPVGSVPLDLSAAIPGDVFPAITASTFPRVEPLRGVVAGNGQSVDVHTLFTWTPATQGDSMVRLFTSTAGGFFLEEGITVTCLVPDTGSFRFPPITKTQLGADFSGGLPLMSRVVVDSIALDTAVFFLIRESFAD